MAKHEYIIMTSKKITVIRKHDRKLQKRTAILDKTASEIYYLGLFLEVKGRDFVTFLLHHDNAPSRTSLHIRDFGQNFDSLISNMLLLIEQQTCNLYEFSLELIIMKIYKYTNSNLLEVHFVKFQQIQTRTRFKIMKISQLFISIFIQMVYILLLCDQHHKKRW